jgi:DinB superfamily
VRDLQPILTKLARAQAEFLRAADPIGSSQWRDQPRAGCWSAGELVAHLCDVERGVRSYAQRIIRKAPLPVPLYKRLHVPLALGVRERTLAFLEETRHRDLRAYGWRHPFLGRLNFYNWFQFIAAHEIRHSKQMWELVKILRKGVASSRN